MGIVDFILSNWPYFEDFITRNIYHSNAIEGSTLSYAETYAIVFNDNSFRVNASPREFYEAVNLKYALSYLLQHIEEPLSQDFIKQVGILINENIHEIDGYRRGQVFIRGASHIPPAPGMVPSLMMQLLYDREHTQYASPFEKAARTHIEFERIHPFPDGNGRTGRVILNYEMLREDLPPVVIPVEWRTEYFSMLSACDVSRLSDFFRELSDLERQRIQAFSLHSSNEREHENCERNEKNAFRNAEEPEEDEELER